ncbi:MAG TPA: hypothetical protein VFQ25_10305 [Ktedonobacterales bacterium]|nr:hypothetical protein [Ktedonobacterales bacterium]
MAQARKAPAKAARPVAQAKAGTLAKPAALAPVIRRPPNEALRMALGILLLAAITGVAPMALAGQVFGYWRISLSPPALTLVSSVPVYDAPLAKARPMVTNATVHVVSIPGGGTAVATLQPGFPVQVTRYATAGGIRWAQIRWAGPTKAAGGSGWAQATLLQAPTASGTKPIGDLAAFSAAIARGAREAGSGFAASLYFPASGYAYRTTTATRTVILGQQIIAIVLVADYGLGLAARQPGSINRDLVSGDAAALTFVYHAVGGAPGMSAFLTRHHITGFRFASDPTQSTATIQGLALFYSALTAAPLVGPDDQRQIFALLAGASKVATDYAPDSQIGSGALFVTTLQSGKGYYTIAAGQLQPASGHAVVVAAISSEQATAATSQTALRAFFKPFIAALG